MAWRRRKTLDFLDALPPQGEGCVIWPFHRLANGYGQVWDAERGCLVLVHRFVCERRHGAPPTALHQAAHSCGMGHEGCIAPWHLFWKTRQENMDEAKVSGRMRRGSSHPRSRLTADDVLQIRRGGKTQDEFAEMFGITQSSVWAIIHRKTWGHL